MREERGGQQAPSTSSGRWRYCLDPPSTRALDVCATAASYPSSTRRRQQHRPSNSCVTRDRASALSPSLSAVVCLYLPLSFSLCRDRGSWSCTKQGLKERRGWDVDTLIFSLEIPIHGSYLFKFRIFSLTEISFKCHLHDTST